MRHTTSLFVRSFVVALGIMFASACETQGPAAPTPNPNTNPGPPPGDSVRASIGALVGIWDGSPALHGGVSTLLTPAEDGCYYGVQQQGAIDLPVVHPRVKGRWIKLTQLRDQFVGQVVMSERVYPDESAIVGGIGWYGGFIVFPDRPGTMAPYFPL